MACSNCGKATNMCGEIIFSPCVVVEGFKFPEFSGIEEDCASLDVVIEDVYSVLSDLQIDLSDFESRCLEHGEEITVKSILNVHDTAICDLKEDVENLQNICNILDKDISECTVDYSCLLGTDPCGDQIIISTLNDLLQVIINKICELEKPSE